MTSLPILFRGRISLLEADVSGQDHLSMKDRTALFANNAG